MYFLPLLQNTTSTLLYNLCIFKNKLSQDQNTGFERIQNQQFKSLLST